MTEVMGRGGRVIVVDESQAQALSDALIGLPRGTAAMSPVPAEPVVVSPMGDGRG